MHTRLLQLIQEYSLVTDGDEQLKGIFDKLSNILNESDDEKRALENALSTTASELGAINQQFQEQLFDVKNYQKEIEISYSKQKALINASREAVITFSADGRLDQFNDKICLFLGIHETEIQQYSTKKFIKTLLSKLRKPDKFLRIIKKINKNNLSHFQGFLESKDHKHYEFHTIAEVIGDRYIGRAWNFRDITDLRNQQLQLAHQANHDTLTNLPNRSFINHRIKQGLKISKRSNRNLAVLFIDLDDFKKINDTIGHKEGDRFLINIAKKIQASVREIDTVGRLGGDEFIIVAEDFSSLTEIEYIYKRILNLFNEPFTIKGNHYSISCSIGISTFPKDGNTPEELIRKADMAMYEAKRNGKHGIYYYDEHLEKTLLQQVSIEEQLLNALKNNEFILYYQPKVHLLSNELKGAEALIRWQKPDGSIIPPAEFIPFAESIGIISDITEKIIHLVFEQIIQWRGSIMTGVPVSINFSARDLANETLIDMLIDAVQTDTIQASDIEIELTETAIFEDIAYVKSLLKKLKVHGIKVAIDDFGTGYSSLSHLQHLNIDYLKIDKSFVNGIGSNYQSRSIVKSILDIGLNLGIGVIAEGIETEFERDFLRRNGCPFGQGYFFKQPVLPEELENLHRFK